MAGKQLGKLRQWAGEMITFSKEKTTLTDEFVELENDVELRRVGIERLHTATSDYHSYLLKKRSTDALDEPQKLMPIESLGLVMINHGEQFGDDSAFGQSLVKFGRGQLKIASLQEEYAKSLSEGYITHLERVMTDISEYQAQRKKLDSRRLAYDAAITKASKQFKKEKEQKEAEEECAKAKARYEEVSEDVQARMIAIQENEVQQWQDLTAFLDVQLKFVTDYANIVQDIQREWISESSIKRLPPAKPKTAAHMFPQRATTPTSSSRRERAQDTDSDSESPTSTPAKSRKDSVSRSKAEKDSVRTPSSARRRADSSGTMSSAKRMSVAGWASNAVSSVTSIGRSGPKDSSRDKFASLDDQVSDDDQRPGADDDGDDERVVSRPASRGSSRTIGKRSPGMRTAPLPPTSASKIRTAPSQVQRKIVRALFDYNPNAGDELSFRSGEELVVVSEVADEWWMGEHTADASRRGLFPVSYVEEVKRRPPPALPLRPRMPDDSVSSLSSSNGIGSSLTLQEKAQRAMADEPPPTPSDVEDDVFGDARYARSPTTYTEDSDDDSDDQLGRPLVRRSGSSASIGRINGSATPGKKAPPPPPPARRGSSTLGHASRSQSVGSIPSTLLARATASPFAGHSSNIKDNGSQDDIRADCADCGCDDFVQNKFKGKGHCNSCFHVHSTI